MKYIASVSFGKDSLAMLLRLLEENKPLDEVVFYDTGMEFKSIYNIRDKIIEILKEKNIKFTELKPKCSFEYCMFEKPVKSGKPNEHKGYSWCGGSCRWGTMEKIRTIEKYCQNAYEYIGIAIDEPKRLEKERRSNKIFPLAEWNMTEKDCLSYCYDRGFDWIEDGIHLYDILDCANKNLKELKNYYLYLPTYWEKLKKLQSKTIRPFKYNKYSIFDLEKRFKGENQ